MDFEVGPVYLMKEFINGIKNSKEPEGKLNDEDIYHENTETTSAISKIKFIMLRNWSSHKKQSCVWSTNRIVIISILILFSFLFD